MDKFYAPNSSHLQGEEGKRKTEIPFAQARTARVYFLNGLDSQMTRKVRSAAAEVKGKGEKVALRVLSVRKVIFRPVRARPMPFATNGEAKIYP